MAQLAADSFNRTASNDLGSNWSPISAGPFSIGSGGTTAVVTATGADAVEVYIGTAPATAEHYAEVVLSTTGTGLSNGYGPAVRWDVVTGTGYWLVGNASGWEIARFNNGVYTRVGRASTTTFAAGNTLRLEARTVGAQVQLTVKKNGTTVTTLNDTSASRITAVNGWGLAFSDGGSPGSGVDSWAAGDLSSSSTSSVNGSALTPGVTAPAYVLAVEI